jgi:hypothetical protein
MYTSPIAYSSYDCASLKTNIVEVTDQVRQATGQQRRAHTRDEVAMGVGLFVFWPALFLISGDSNRENLAYLKGKYQALNDEAVLKNCPVAAEIRADQAVAEPPGVDHRNCSTVGDKVVCR